MRKPRHANVVVNFDMKDSASLFSFGVLRTLKQYHLTCASVERDDAHHCCKLSCAAATLLIVASKGGLGGLAVSIALCSSPAQRPAEGRIPVSRRLGGGVGKGESLQRTLP